MAKKIISCTAFLLIFAVIFTGLTLLFYPKWKSDTEKNPSYGFYSEEKNSVDVLLLGSCNMYTSFSPVLFFEKYGVTSYCRCCPDQSFLTSYYYLKDSLKYQTPKAVVLKALFLTDEDTVKREYYNREALEYLRPSFDKIRMIFEISRYEIAALKELGQPVQDYPTTVLGYLFPLIRYHSRADLSAEDINFFSKNDPYSFNKGSIPCYSYTSMKGLIFPETKNGDEIREDAKKYFPKIVSLCRERNIPLTVVKSPNRWRWDDKTTKTARDFVESFGVDFTDSNDLENFFDYDVQYSTGRLNIYGMKKFTAAYGRYLTEKYKIPPTPLSDSLKLQWNNCVLNLYTRAGANGFAINDGSVANVSCKKEGLNIRWNECSDCGRYNIYRSTDNKNFELIATASGSDYTDTETENGKMYYYRIEPLEGENRDIKSNVCSYVFVTAPTGFKAKKDGQNVILSWDPAKEKVGNCAVTRSSSDNSFVNIKNIGDGTTALTDTTPYVFLNGNMYYSIFYEIKVGEKWYRSERMTAFAE